ncbi:hypothetical protein [Haloferula sargassicola]|uniref:Uncharacterized protein n=1 Tax=Haloferula sargassicola TaxID=490096 RepID=A0ABP9UHT8_9BACT
MSTIDPKEHPEKWLEQKAGEGADKARSCCDEIKEAARENPAQALAIAFGAGYLARSLPIFRTASLTLRGSLHLLPYVLGILGAARVYEVVRDEYLEDKQPQPEGPEVAP